jgi:hypothetical protein
MRGIWIAALALFAAAPVCAQTTIDAAVPRGIPDSSMPQSRELSAPAAAPAAQVVQPKVPRLVTTNDRHLKDADARRCLQFTTNREIHRCATRYLPREARAKLTRTRAAKAEEAAAKSAASPKAPADIGKADLSKAAPASKPVETAKVVPSPAPAPAAAEKPSATPKAAPPQQAAAKSGEKPP